MRFLLTIVCLLFVWCLLNTVLISACLAGLVVCYWVVMIWLCLFDVLVLAVDYFGWMSLGLCFVLCFSW